MFNALKSQRGLAPIIITLIIIGIVVVVGGIYWWQKSSSVSTSITSTVTPTSTQNIILSSLIKGCAETDKGMATKSFGEGTEQEPKIQVNGNQITYSRAINHLCCRKAEIQKEIISSTINIFEDWSGIGCKCMCFSEIKATVSNIPSGSYAVNVYEKGIKPGNIDEPMKQKLIITQNIDIQ